MKHKCEISGCTKQARDAGMRCMRHTYGIKCNGCNYYFSRSKRNNTCPNCSNARGDPTLGQSNKCRIKDCKNKAVVAGMCSMHCKTCGAIVSPRWGNVKHQGLCVDCFRCKMLPIARVARTVPVARDAVPVARDAVSQSFAEIFSKYAQEMPLYSSNIINQ